MTIVCGDSHTSTHGAFGALAFGIGTSEVEHVLATQTLPQRRPGTWQSTVEGDAARRGHRQGHGPRHHRPDRHGGRHRPRHRVPRPAIRSLSMEGRMTVCNMSIEAGARAGMVAPDDMTFAYLEGATTRPKARPGRRPWTSGARSPPTQAPPSTGRPARRLQLAPYVTWGTNPAWSRRSTAGPRPAAFDDAHDREAATGRSSTWACGRTPIATSLSTPSSSARAPTPGSRTCGPRPAVLAAAGPRRAAGAGRARLAPGQGPGRGRGSRRLHRGRLRMAGAGVLDVPGDEPRQAGARANGRRRPRTELRGTPGSGRPHAPGLARRGRRHRRGRPLRQPRGPD